MGHSRATHASARQPNLRLTRLAPHARTPEQALYRRSQAYLNGGQLSEAVADARAALEACDEADAASRAKLTVHACMHRRPSLPRNAAEISRSVSRSMLVLVPPCLHLPSTRRLGPHAPRAVSPLL